MQDNKVAQTKLVIGPWAGPVYCSHDFGSNPNFPISVKTFFLFFPVQWPGIFTSFLENWPVRPVFSGLIAERSYYLKKLLRLPILIFSVQLPVRSGFLNYAKKGKFPCVCHQSAPMKVGSAFAKRYPLISDFRKNRLNKSIKVFPTNYNNPNKLYIDFFYNQKYILINTTTLLVDHGTNQHIKASTMLKGTPSDVHAIL